MMTQMAHISLKAAVFVNKDTDDDKNDLLSKIVSNDQS